MQQDCIESAQCVVRGICNAVFSASVILTEKLCNEFNFFVFSTQDSNLVGKIQVLY